MVDHTRSFARLLGGIGSHNDWSRVTDKRENRREKPRHFILSMFPGLLWGEIDGSGYSSGLSSVMTACHRVKSFSSDYKRLVMMSGELPQSETENLPPPWDWSGIPAESVREMVRQGEAMMADILVASCASDARASSLSGVFATIAAGLIAGSAALSTITTPNTGVLASLITMALGFIFSGFICFGASRPRDYYTSGSDPERNIEVARYLDRELLMKETAESLHRKITYNSDVLSKQTRLTRWSYIVCGITVAASGLIFAFSYFS